MKVKYKAGDRLTLRIEKIVPRGYGLAFAEGLTVFVSLAAAGDEVAARLREVKGKTAFAEIEEIILPSPDRVEPPCPYFGACGGCDFMQMSYEAQLAAKVAMIRDSVSRIGKIEYPGEIGVIPSPDPWNYRLRAQWHANTREGRIGYFRRNSRDLIDIARCPILSPDMERELERLRAETPWEKFSVEKVQIDAAAGDGGEISLSAAELSGPAREIAFSAAGERYLFSARSFFQGNRFLVEKLIESAIGDASGDTALDLYSGVGLFSIPLARRFRNVIGVEENGEAVGFARRNAELAGLTNIEFRVDSVRNYLADHEPGPVDLVLLDPPRAGTEKDTMERLIGLGPKRVSYVACDPSVLARDLKRFDEAGYAIDSMTAIDLFPQTHHVETVVWLSPA